jgi:hypothetical protein
MESQGQSFKKLHEFLEELASDASLLQKYIADKETTLTGSGISPAHQELLRNDDLEGVKAAVLQELGKPIQAVRIFAIF